jgi:hypothetical protein
MTKIILFILLVLVILVLGPFLTIWSMNTLFPALSIPYTFDTWCATVLMGAFFRANVSVKK